MDESKITERGVYGCLVVVLFSVLSIVASVAVGVFFGVGFGLLAYALFIVFATVCVLRAFKKAGN